jgi:hypothetical protein
MDLVTKELEAIVANGITGVAAVALRGAPASSSSRFPSRPGTAGQRSPCPQLEHSASVIASPLSASELSADAATVSSNGGSSKASVEIMLPELQRLPLGERFLPFAVVAEHLGFDEYGVDHQGLTSHHYYPRTGDYAMSPRRYVRPSELDLMARLAGMELREALERLAARAVHGRESTKHVSVWEKR